jgi:thiol-disulfide isomerase/thioredoxin
MMKFIITSLLVSTLLFGYQKGDMVSPTISKKLDLKNDKIYIIDFFASWCGSCKEEMPLLIKASQEMDKSKFELIGVDVDEELAKGEAFQKELNISFRVVNDPKNEIIKAFDPLGMPSLYVIKEGKVVDFLFGAKDNIDKLIADELKELSK